MNASLNPAESCGWNISFPGKCENSLATPLPYSSFTSSSVYAGGYGAGYAKLNRKQGLSLPEALRTVCSVCVFSGVFGLLGFSVVAVDWSSDPVFSLAFDLFMITVKWGLHISSQKCLNVLTRSISIQFSVFRSSVMPRQFFEITVSRPIKAQMSLTCVIFMLLQL